MLSKHKPLLPLLVLLALATAATAQGTAQTEFKLGVDRTLVKVDKLGKNDAPTLQDVLGKRVEVVAGSMGEVEVKDRDEIRVRVPLEKLTAAQVRILTRPGRIEFRTLEDVHSNLNPDGRYLINVLTVQNEKTLGFLDRRTNQAISPAAIIKRSPLLLSNEDFLPNGAYVVGTSLVRVRLTERAEGRFKQFLKKPGRLMAVVLDGEILAINASVVPITPPRRSKKPKGEVVAPEGSAPAPSESSALEVDVPGNYAAPEEAAQLAGMINAGVLPYPLTVRSQRIVAESQSSKE